MSNDVRLADLHERIARLRWALYGTARNTPERQAVEQTLIQCYHESFAIYYQRLGLDAPPPRRPPTI